MSRLLKEIMTPAPKTISPSDTIREAARLMRDFDTGFLPVVGNKIEGVITDRDITVRAVAEGTNPDECKVSDVMTAEYHALYEDQEAEEAMELMEAQQVRRILVLGRGEEIAGVISLGDVSLRNDDDQRAQETLEQVSIPNQSKQGSAGSASPNLQ